MRAEPPLRAPRRPALAAVPRQQDARSHLRFLRQLLPAKHVQLSAARELHRRERPSLLSALTPSARPRWDPRPWRLPRGPSKRPTPPASAARPPTKKITAPPPPPPPLR